MFLKREPTLGDSSLHAPMRNSVRQPLFACLFACFGLIDQLLEEHTGSNVVGPKESSFELDTFRGGHDSYETCQRLRRKIAALAVRRNRIMPWALDVLHGIHVVFLESHRTRTDRARCAVVE